MTDADRKALQDYVAGKLKEHELPQHMQDTLANPPLYVSRPAHCFRGCKHVDGTFTPYPSIDAMQAEYQYQKNITGTVDQFRFWVWVPVTLAMHGLWPVRKAGRMRLAA